MLRKTVLAIAAVVAVSVGFAAPANAQPVYETAVAANNQQPFGIDVSWPQCGKKLPTGQAYALVGVNNGVANTTNPCLQEQLAWANTSTGTTAQPKVSLYVNTSNPGFSGSGKKVAWPSSNTYEGVNVSVPEFLGSTVCDGKENFGNMACAYMYGWGLAYDDANKRGISNPKSYMWWLDVEVINSWNIINKQANAAVLEGMNDYFTEYLGAKTGLYTSNGDWYQIVGLPSKGSKLGTLPVWYPIGRNDRSAAVHAYKTMPSPNGGQIVMVQYIQGGFDRNYLGRQSDVDTLTASQAQPTLWNTFFGFLLPRTGDDSDNGE